MKPFLVDVPVKTTIWTRPYCQRKQFEIIKKARPSVLILVSDGGRNDEEWKQISINRKMFEEEINWECTIYKLYEDRNQGVWTMINKGHEFVWSKVNRCIFLEDDDVPAVSFFRFCKEMLDKYENDTRIGMICGCNLIEKNRECNADYFFTRSGCIWGIATWKRITESFNFNYRNDQYAMQLLRDRTKDNQDFWKTIRAYEKGDYCNGHIATDEFFYGLSFYAYNQLRIVPKYNMISNIGSNEESAHSGDYKMIPHGIRRIFRLKTYEVDFPLKHPSYIIEDRCFEKRVNRLLAYNMPVLSFFRRAERIILQVRYGNGKKAIKRWYSRAILKIPEK